MRRALVLVLSLVGSLLVLPGAATAQPAAEATLQGVQSVAVGYDHSCAVLTSGQVRCWGANYYGELGNQSATEEFPTAVVVKNASGTGPLQNVVQLALGEHHSCALLTVGQVRCWGGNNDGQLGTGDFDDSPQVRTVRNAIDTGPLTNVRAISAEASGTCALLTNDQVRCWGDDQYGQLGNGSPEQDSGLPVVVKGVGGNGSLSDIASIAGGFGNNCAVTAGGQGRCWGRSNGALGNGDLDESPVPVRVLNAQTGDPLTGVTQISIGGFHGCARLSSGQARCWGDNDEGALGTGGTGDNTRAVLVRRAGGTPLRGVVSIFATYQSTCARVGGGQVRCWGDDGNGENGDGTFEAPAFRKLPAPVVNSTGSANLTDVRQLAGKSFHFCVVQTSDQVRCWGYNDHGNLGYGGFDDRAKPALVQV